MPKNTWTAKQIATLRALVDTTPRGELARKLGMSREAVNKKVVRLGLCGRSPTPRHAWTDGELDTLRAEVKTTPRRELAKKIGRSYAEVARKAAELGLGPPAKAPHTFWTREKLDLLHRLAATTTASELGQRLGCTPRMVLLQLRRDGLGPTPFGNRKIWAPEEIGLLRKLAGTATLTEIGRRLGCSKSAVGEQLDRLGLDKLPQGGRRVAWTEKQLDLLRAEAGITPREELTRKLGRSGTEVKKKILDLGLDDSPPGHGWACSSDIDYSADETEFMFAMHEFIVRTGRKFPTWSEALGVVRSLGYEQTKARATRSA